VKPTPLNKRTALSRVVEMILHGVAHKEFFAERNSGEPLGEPVRLFQEGGPLRKKGLSTKPRLATLQDARRRKSDEIPSVM
jgi:hypothetical protein